MIIPFQDLSPQARIWIYPSSRKFYNEELPVVEEKITHFLANWLEDISVGYQIFYDRFLIVGADQDDVVINTQQLDKLVQFILFLQDTFKVELLDRMNVCFKQGEFVQYKELKEFQQLIKQKAVSQKTIVFDNLIETKEELEQYWEIPITESWYNRFL